ncbi:MAG TPA: lamin tail domain-containing protein [Candidatus Polarisedimenticolia bacterium]|jgi:cytosine/adenosine deaminase-related metal-dependent hydrolase|nr:lamin tail domain-containing protein [Candidatus Polarisedimenticolia bacterium]
MLSAPPRHAVDFPLAAIPLVVLMLLPFCAGDAAAQETPSLQVALNEIAWMGTTTSATDEWIELVNNTSAAISLAGWTLTAADGTPSIVLAGSIPAGGHFLLERTDDNTVPGIAADQIFTGALENTGEILSLRDATGGLQDFVNAWHAGNSTTRQTMQRVDPLQPGDLASNWTNGPVDGTPMNSGGSGGVCDPPTRRVDCRPGPPFQLRVGGPVAINELMINPAAVLDASGEYVEIYNSGPSPVDLQGWTLRDDGSDFYTIPSGAAVLVQPGGFLVIAAQADAAHNGGFTADLAWSGFNLSNSGDEVVLVDRTGVEQDRIGYTGSPFTDGSGGSLERVSPRLPTSDPLSWEVARSSFGLGDRGTPGRVNALQSRRYVLRGTLVTMDETLPEADQVFPGTLYLQGNRILDLLAEGEPLPADAAGAPIIATGALIFPGLMNIHDHITFNTTPAWDVPSLMQDVSDWTSLDGYRQNVRYPHDLLTEANYYDLLPEVGKYAEVKALAAGTTTEQGSFPLSAGFSGHLARNVDVANFGVDRIRQRSLSILDSTFQTSEAPALVADMEAGGVDVWLVHLGEGTAEDAVLEFPVLKNACLLRSETVIIHGSALAPSELDDLAAAGAKLVIAPTSNYLYYGATADVPGAVQRGIPVSLSTDWSPAGDKNLLASLKSLALINETVWAGALTDRDMVDMVTTNPARALNWCRQVGSLRAGMVADIAIIAGDPARAFRAPIEATEEDILLTVVDGDPLYGRPDWMAQLKPGDYETVGSLCGFQAALDVTDPGVPGGSELFSDIRGLLAAASASDFQHMKANFQDPAVAGMTDAEFQAYLDARFPLGIIPRPLDPLWIIDDADYFDGLRNPSNVSALDPAATLDISAWWDVDGDAALNACDNCPDLANPGQGPVVFGGSILATDAATFSWSVPTDVKFVRGDLGSVSGYPVDRVGELSHATSLTDATSPAAGSGFYYLVRPGGTCLVGSWQTILGAEPGRDAVLP